MSGARSRKAFLDPREFHSDRFVKEHSTKGPFARAGLWSGATREFCW